VSSLVIPLDDFSPLFYGMQEETELKECGQTIALRTAAEKNEADDLLARSCAQCASDG
jgi:hypothetical protein